MLEDLGAAGVQEIRMIEAALDRIENGSYGICVRCGDPIGEERLDVLPQTPALPRLRRRAAEPSLLTQGCQGPRAKLRAVPAKEALACSTTSRSAPATSRAPPASTTPCSARSATAAP